MKSNTEEIDPLIKNLGVSTNRSWKKRAVIMITVLLILLVLYLIVSSLSPSFKLNNKNDSIESQQFTTSSHIVGQDPFRNLDACNSYESPPQLIAYHAHALFDGNDQKSISYAYATYHKFIQAMNPDMAECKFAHSLPAVDQTEICYFPTTWQETDFPIPSNFIFQISNYAFYIPPTHLQQAITFWMQHHDDTANDNFFDYVIHTVSGCQLNDHTKWLIVSGGYDGQLVTDNLICCHNGPALCTCNVVQYQLNEQDDTSCLGIQFLHDNDIQFIHTSCENPMTRNLGSWREVFYKQERNWIQIENYGDIDHPMYLCLAAINKNENYCDIGTEIKIKDCSYKQDIENDIWVSPQTQFIYNLATDQIQLLGCNQQELCVNIADTERDNVLKLSVASCETATVFNNRHFFP